MREGVKTKTTQTFKSTRKTVVSKRDCGEQEWRASPTLVGQSRGSGGLQTRRTPGHAYTLFRFGRARKRIPSRKTTAFSGPAISLAAGSKPSRAGSQRSARPCSGQGTGRRTASACCPQRPLSQPAGPRPGAAAAPATCPGAMGEARPPQRSTRRCSGWRRFTGTGAALNFG